MNEKKRRREGEEEKRREGRREEEQDGWRETKWGKKRLQDERRSFF